MSEWIDITQKAKKKLPVIDRAFLDRYIDEYSTRRYIRMMSMTRSSKSQKMFQTPLTGGFKLCIFFL